MGKKVEASKRHLVVETLGLPWPVAITAARLLDRDAAAPVAAQAMEKAHPALRVDVARHPGSRSTGTCGHVPQPLWPEVVPSGFVVQAKRWASARPIPPWPPMTTETV